MSNLTYSVTLDESNDCPSESRVLTLVSNVFSGEQINWSDISIVLTDHSTVLDLNKNWLEHDYHTDVISFLLEEDRQSLEGEIYVDVDTARARHVEFGTTVIQELERYIVHGLLHLAGYDDASDEERSHMKTLEDQYLSR
ncbi:MAG: rRNA maturation RNase YbeY [Bacteroidetes Order II. Incertae sedis bacterium]|nr:rRNA maturation RNase YbeY [Bacteroidetes Order II. bacterium]